MNLACVGLISNITVLLVLTTEKVEWAVTYYSSLIMCRPQ